MKNLLHLPLLLLCCSSFGQDLKDPVDLPQPQIILQTGIGLQWFGNNYKLYTLAVEPSINHFWHLGLQGSFYFRDKLRYDFSNQDLLGGYEVGAFAKYFVHGRFSGHKSGLYFGPEFRFGSRKFQISFKTTTPLK